jgi:AcrR family transcriptional regulator
METLPTRTRLVQSAAHLFRLHGYHGTGVAQILEHSNAPKGSLYHHFPDGKSGLALAAVDWVSDGMLQIIDDAFGTAATYTAGATTFCFKLAKLFDINEDWQSCPVSTMLFDAPENSAFRNHANRILTSWSNRTAQHATRLGMGPARAREEPELLLMTVQGAWTIARARGSSDPIRRIPDYLFG